MDRRMLNDLTKKVDRGMKYVKTDNITDTNGLKQRTVHKPSQPWWKRRIGRDIKRTRKNLNVLERCMRNETRNSNKKKRKKKEKKQVR